MACMRGKTLISVDGGVLLGDMFSKADLSVDTSPECRCSGELILRWRRGLEPENWLLTATDAPLVASIGRCR